VLYKLIAPTPFGSDQETGKSRHVLRYSNRMNATRARVQWLIPTLRKRSKPWAILCRHRHDPEVGEHSLNPCLVAGSRNVISGVNPQFREPIGQFCSGSLTRSTPGVRSRQGCSR
jgi:hypothetical protein